MARKATFATLLLAFLFGSARAVCGQTLDVTVLEQHSEIPVVGAMVALLDASGVVESRDLTEADGRATIRPPSAGTWRVRVERIGYAGISTVIARRRRSSRDHPPCADRTHQARGAASRDRCGL